MTRAEDNGNSVQNVESNSVWQWFKEWGVRVLERMGRSEVY